MENAKNEKVKIKVTEKFRDKFNKTVCYEIGQELEFESERAEDVVARNLAEYVDPIG